MNKKVGRPGYSPVHYKKNYKKNHKNFNNMSHMTNTVSNYICLKVPIEA